MGAQNSLCNCDAILGNQKQECNLQTINSNHGTNKIEEDIVNHTSEKCNDIKFTKKNSICTTNDSSIEIQREQNMKKKQINFKNEIEISKDWKKFDISFLINMFNFDKFPNDKLIYSAEYLLHKNLEDGTFSKILS